MSDGRATGWKIPLLFCAVILGAVSITVVLRQEKVDVAPIPAALLQEAKAIHMNLDGNEDGKTWKERISSTAGAFATRAEKDIRLTALIRDAAEKRRFDAACTASVLMYNDHQRDAVLLEVSNAALQECKDLPWAVMASGGMTSAATLSALNKDITVRWEECAKDQK